MNSQREGSNLRSKSQSHSNIFPSTVSSRNSVHFVPGNRFWIERKIQQRNRRQDEQKRVNQENDKYFAKVTAENQILENWSKSHPLVARCEARAGEDHLADSLFMDATQKEKIDREIRQECIDKLSILLLAHSSRKDDYDCHTKAINPLAALKFLFDFKTFYEQFEARRLKDYREIRLNLYEQPYNSSRDPLRRVCFLIKGLLSYNKDRIFSLMKLLKQVSKFLTDEEQSELCRLNNRCFQIMDMYLQMNDLRNEHFFRMYSEEKQELWAEQKTVWRSEIDIWDSLMIKLLQSNYQIVFDKVSKHLASAETLLEKRILDFDQLQRYYIETENNPFLRPILQKDVSYFKV